MARRQLVPHAESATACTEGLMWRCLPGDSRSRASARGRLVLVPLLSAGDGRMRDVESALLLLGKLPPPPPGADVLAGLDGARAGRASDRGESLVMQRVVRNVVLADVVPDAIQAPVRDRVD